MLAADLDKAVRAVCPIYGVSVGNELDKSTWLIDFTPDATQAQRDAAAQVVISFVPIPPPDVTGFIADLKVAMGGIVPSNALAKAYPLFQPALEQGVWVDVQALTVDAHTTGVLTDVQYAAFKQLFAKHNIPVTLP